MAELRETPCVSARMCASAPRASTNPMADRRAAAWSLVSASDSSGSDATAARSGR